MYWVLKTSFEVANFELKPYKMYFKSKIYLLITTSSPRHTIDYNVTLTFN